MDSYLKRIAPLIIVPQISLMLFCAPVFGEQPETAAAAKDSWQSIESNYFTIYYRPTANLDRIQKELSKRKLYFDQTARYGHVTSAEEICRRLDKLYNRVKETLDMYPLIEKIGVKIFKDRNELNAEYFKIFNKKDGYKSFYINKYNTIYTSEADISDSIMIHEMAHAVIDHYFSVPPPERIAEILASYVDAHLEE